ncbi:MAG: deoxyribonuclease IV [Desulfomonilaceae bacterium]
MPNALKPHCDGSLLSQETKEVPLLGAHVSIAGGVHRAIGRGEGLGCTAIQIFTKNAAQWQSNPLAEEDVKKFRQERTRTGIMVVVHDAYLINLGSPNTALLKKSQGAFMEEMERAEQLGVPYLIMHPGAHSGSGEDAGIRSVARSFNIIFRKTAGFQVKILIENTAGQGTALGHSFEQLRRILEETNEPERMGVCLDSCHAFAAGYDLRGPSDYQTVMDRFDTLIGLDRLKALHLNDCKKGLGLKVDRHEHLGKGMLGLEFFRLVMNDPRFRHIPKIIETPKFLEGEDMDTLNLGLLRGLVIPEGSADNS